MSKYFAFIFGIIIVLGCFFGIWRVLPPIGHSIDKNTEHLIFLFAGGVFFGGLLMIPTIIIPAIKQLLDVVGTYIPVIGGRRPADPPAPPPPPVNSGGPI
jgi:hypothetical protein